MKESDTFGKKEPIVLDGKKIGFEKNFFHCPICGIEIKKKENYCRGCGIGLKWWKDDE